MQITGNIAEPEQKWIADWRDRQSYHQSRIEPLLKPYLHARSRGARQPVADFLFEYYSFRPGKLMTWNPGFRSTLPPEWTPSDKLYILKDDGWQLNPEDFPEKRISSLQWVIDLQQAILNRPPAFGCFGLHEWAMVYKTDEVRHNQLPLRLDGKEIDRFVESRPIRCSHFDAYRFFTSDATPLNQLHPDATNRAHMEQGGCIHANMDLYKWAYKFYPWIGSDLLADAFLLAWRTREFDMQASPYDLKAYGIEPICIETEDGRKEYQVRQQEIADLARPLRQKLTQELRDLMIWVTIKQAR